MYEYHELPENYNYNNGENAAFKAGRDAFIGYAIGSQIDRTRFGIWFNDNPIINTIYGLMKLGFILSLIILAIWFTVIFITQP